MGPIYRSSTASSTDSASRGKISLRRGRLRRMPPEPRPAPCRTVSAPRRCRRPLPALTCQAGATFLVAAHVSPLTPPGSRTEAAARRLFALPGAARMTTVSSLGRRPRRRSSAARKHERDGWRAWVHRWAEKSRADGEGVRHSRRSRAAAHQGQSCTPGGIAVNKSSASDRMLVFMMGTASPQQDHMRCTACPQAR